MLMKIVFLLTLIDYCVSIENNTIDFINGTSMMKMFERKSRVNVVSFEPLGEHIEMGLDFLLPFLKVPIVRKSDANINEPALININTAALLSTGFLATSSALVSYIFRKYVAVENEEIFSEKRQRSENLMEHELLSTLNNFKLVYTNSSGIRVDTTLPQLFDTINETFQKNDIDLKSCINKSICKRIQLSALRINEGSSSGLDKIIDGLIGIKWLRNLLHHTSLKDALNARNIHHLSNQQQSKNYCHIKYPQCKWSWPEKNLQDFINTYLKFT